MVRTPASHSALHYVLTWSRAGQTVAAILHLPKPTQASSHPRPQRLRLLPASHLQGLMKAGVGMVLAWEILSAQQRIRESIQLRFIYPDFDSSRYMVPDRSQSRRFNEQAVWRCAFHI
jgi:hypothetical protein